MWRFLPLIKLLNSFSYQNIKIHDFIILCLQITLGLHFTYCTYLAST